MEDSSMEKKKSKIIEKHIDKDVELCRSTNVRVVKQTMQVLVDERIPFTQNWMRVPFTKREKYRGAKEVCVIRTHCNQYQQARHILDRLDLFYRERIMLHAI